MGKAIEITRAEFSAGELRRLAARTCDGAVVRRLLANRLDPGGPSPRGGGAAQRHGPANAARLGASATIERALADCVPASAPAVRRR